MLELKSWIELIKFLWPFLVIPAGTLALYWRASETSLSVPIRLLAAGILVAVSGILGLVWFSLRKEARIAKLTAQLPVVPERRPEIEDRLLVLLWHHPGVAAAYLVRPHDRPMKEDIRLVEYHLECLVGLRFVAKSYDGRYRLMKPGQDYVAKYALHE